jgi:hypothetical protein
MFHTKVVEKIKTQILRSVTFFFLKWRHLSENAEKVCRQGQATDGNMAHCMLVA